MRIWHILAVTITWLRTTAEARVMLHENTIKCSKEPVEAMFIIDSVMENSTEFQLQLQRTLSTFRFLISAVKSRDLTIGILSMNENSTQQLELGSPFAKKPAKVYSILRGQTASGKSSTRTARTLQRAVHQFRSYGQMNALRVLFLAHNGVNEDFVAETLEAQAALNSEKVTVFAITGSFEADIGALVGYTGDAAKITADIDDKKEFLRTVAEVLGICDKTLFPSVPEQKLHVPVKAHASRTRLYGVRGRSVSEFNQNKMNCKGEKIDLMIVLDTSGSVFSVFEQERQIAQDLVMQFTEEVYAQRLQVSLVKFASTSSVALPFKLSRTRQEVMDAVADVEFTGESTRIAGAVTTAIEELHRARRPDAKQVFVLISDGHGQEFWHVVQSTGHKLQETGAELFAVSASQDYNEAELLIYVAQKSRLFLGNKSLKLIPSLRSYLGSCLGAGGKTALLPWSELATKHTTRATTTTTRITTTRRKPETTTISSTSSASTTITTDSPKIFTSTAKSTAGSPSYSPPLNSRTVPMTTTEMSTTSVVSTTRNATTSTASSTTVTATTNSPVVTATTITPEKACNDVQKKPEVEESSGQESSGEDAVKEESVSETQQILVSTSSREKEPKKHVIRNILKSASCGLDVMLLIDQSVVDFDSAIQTVESIVGSFSNSLLTSRQIRIGAISFEKVPTLTFHLGSSRLSMNAAIRKVSSRPSAEPSLVQAIMASMLRLWPNRRPSARAVTVIITDAEYSDKQLEIDESIQRLHGYPNSKVFAISPSTNHTDLLEKLTKSASNVFDSSGEKELIQALMQETGHCKQETSSKFTGESPTQKPIATVVKTTKTEQKSSNSTISDVIASSTTAETTSSTTTTTTSTTTTSTTKSPTTITFAHTPKAQDVVAHGIKTADSFDKIEEISGRPKFDGCDVDLMFVIDVSSSIDKEFTEELKFAVDLVKRLPASSLDERVRVGVVTVNKIANLHTTIGAVKSRSDLIERLISIENTGGSTFLAKGIQLATDELQNRGRKRARKILVLVSDGHGQDLWSDVIGAATRLRSVARDVFAVSISKNYSFRELEVYAGDKTRVYINGRTRRYLDDIENSVRECGRSMSSETNSALVLHPGFCEEEDPVDVVLAVVTASGTSSEEEFYHDKQIAINLVAALPETLFKKRLAFSILTMSSNMSEIELSLGLSSKKDVIFELERLEHSSGDAPTNLHDSTKLLTEELEKNHRSNARIIVVGFGNIPEGTLEVPSKSLSFITTLREKAETSWLPSARKYIGDKIDYFIMETGTTIVECANQEKVAKQQRAAEPVHPTRTRSLQELLDLNQLKNNQAEKIMKRCNYDKVDLVIILDASTSREEMFENQRELALSLIERLPIEEDSSSIAVSVTSFSSRPTLRLSLGSNRDKKVVRDSIESIDYRGGSTMTAAAVDVALDDLQKHIRKDAQQIVVLMNDGFSQDMWSRVLTASRRLRDTGAETFGVALGDQVDNRELHRYIGGEKRIYRDGSTKKFLDDVVGLLKGEKDCVTVPRPEPRVEAPSSRCEMHDLDIVVVFDVNDKSPAPAIAGTNSEGEKAINANRFLLLDVLGSLRSSPGRVRVSLVTFGAESMVLFPFTDINKEKIIVSKIEGMRAIRREAGSYAEALEHGLDIFRTSGRADAESVMVVFGDGVTSDSSHKLRKAGTKAKQMPKLTTMAVDQSKKTNIPTLLSLANSGSLVFDSSRSGQFADQLSYRAFRPECRNSAPRVNAVSTVVIDPKSTGEQVYSTLDSILQKDISIDDKERLGSSEKVIVTKKSSKILNEQNPTKNRATKIHTSTKTPTTTTTTGSPTTTSTAATIATKSTTITTTSNTKPTSTRSTTVRTTRTASTTSSTTMISTTTTRSTTPKRTTTTASTTTNSPTPSSFNEITRRPFIPLTIESEEETPFEPGCLLDLIFLIDSSGSVEETFRREIALVRDVVQTLRIGPNNARVALIKFASKEKVRTIHSMADKQSRHRVLKALDSIPFSSGTTALRYALRKTLEEYSEERGARPNTATPILVVLTDGYGQKSVVEEAKLVREILPNTIAVALNRKQSVSYKELLAIGGGSDDNVFTLENLPALHSRLDKITEGCNIN